MTGQAILLLRQCLGLGSVHRRVRPACKRHARCGRNHDEKFFHLLVPFVTGWIKTQHILSGFGPRWKLSAGLTLRPASQIPEQLIKFPDRCKTVNAPAYIGVDNRTRGFIQYAG